MRQETYFQQNINSNILRRGEHNITSKIKIALGLNIIIVLIGLLVGVQYLVSSEINSYHKEVIGVEWETLAPGVKTLLLILMKGTGDAAVIGAVSIAILLFIPFRRGENWSRWAILTIGLILLVPMLVGALYLVYTTGASSPWWLNAAMMIILITGFLMSGGLKQ